MKAFVCRSVLAAITVLSAAAYAVPGYRELGPQEAGRDYYEIGNERLKLRALIVGSVDLGEVARVVEGTRAQSGTHSWDWKIGYTDLPIQQSLVLAWFNPDSGESAWIAVGRDEADHWFKASNREEQWVDFQDAHLIRRDTSNGFDIVSRVSKTGSSNVAYAFSRTLLGLN